MIKGIEASAERYLTDLSRIEERQARVEREISSGLKVIRPSDAPDRVMNILELRSAIERATTINANLNRVKSEVDTAEAAVRLSVQLVERARVLGAEAASSTAENRAAAAIEIRNIHDQLVSLTRTSSEGRYVFSGDEDTGLLYRADWTQPQGVQRLVQAENTRVLEDVHGSRFSVRMSAHQLFDIRNADDTPADGNAYEALHALGEALENDSPDEVGLAMPKITAALEHLNRSLTFYGHSQNRVKDAITQANQSLLARTRELSETQDTDITESLVTLNLTSVHHQVALGAHAQLPRTTLFDFLG